MEEPTLELAPISYLEGVLEECNLVEPQAKTTLYKTELCRKYYESGVCRYGDKCQFAHGQDQLRALPKHPKYKTERCKTFWTIGSCPYGTRCRFLHGDVLHSAPNSPLLLPSNINSLPETMPLSPSKKVQENIMASNGVDPNFEKINLINPPALFSKTVGVNSPRIISSKPLAVITSSSTEKRDSSAPWFQSTAAHGSVQSSVSTSSPHRPLLEESNMLTSSRLQNLRPDPLITSDFIRNPSVNRAKKDFLSGQYSPLISSSSSSHVQLLPPTSQSLPSSPLLSNNFRTYSVQEVPQLTILSNLDGITTSKTSSSTPTTTTTKTTTSSRSMGDWNFIPNNEVNEDIISTLTDLTLSPPTTEEGTNT